MPEQVSADMHLTAAQTVFQLAELVSVILHHVCLDSFTIVITAGAARIESTYRAFLGSVASLNKAFYISTAPAVYAHIDLAGQRWPSPFTAIADDPQASRREAQLALVDTLLHQPELGRFVRQCELLINKDSILTAHRLLHALPRIEELSLFFNGPTLFDSAAIVTKLRRGTGVLEHMHRLRSVALQQLPGCNWLYQGLPARAICEYLPLFLGRPSQAIKLVHRSLAKTNLQACSALFGDFISSLQYQPIQESGDHDTFSTKNWNALLANLPNLQHLVLDNSNGPSGKFENSLFRALRETKCPIRDVTATKLTKNARGRLYDLLSDPSYLPLLSPTSQYIQDITAGKPKWMARDRLCEIAAKVSRRWE